MPKMIKKFAYLFDPKIVNTPDFEQALSLADSIVRLLVPSWLYNIIMTLCLDFFELSSKQENVGHKCDMGWS